MKAGRSGLTQTAKVEDQLIFDIEEKIQIPSTPLLVKACKIMGDIKMANKFDTILHELILFNPQ